MTSDQLLEKVSDCASFIAFARALAKERREAEWLEAEMPRSASSEGALGWRNTLISRFIESGLCHFEDDSDSLEAPTWRDVALFLYHGKMCE